MKARRTSTAIESGIGAGALSPEADARLSRPPSDADIPFPDLSDLTAVAEWRRREHEVWGEGAVDGEIHHEPMTVAGVDCLVAGELDAPPVVYLHGGGYCLGSPGVAVPITARLARLNRVISVDYRLAPEHPFPAAIDDVLAVYEEVTLAYGAVALAGDSAGGGLALAAAVATTTAGLRPPRSVALLCPHLDHGPADPSDPEPATDVAAMGRSYIGEVDADNASVSPLRADLRRLPKTLVHSGTDDHLFRQAVRFVRRAREADVDVTFDVWDGMWHAWHYHRELPEAHRATDGVARFLALL